MPRQRSSSASASNSRRGRGDLLGELRRRRPARRGARPAGRRAPAPAVRTARAAPGTVCGPTPGTIVRQIRSRRSIGVASARSQSSALAHAGRRDRRRVGRPSIAREHGADVVGARRVGQLDAADAAGQDEADLALAGSSCRGSSRRSGASGSRPGAAVGRPNRSSRRDQPGGRPRGRPSRAARPAGDSATMPTATASPCWKAPP